MPSPNRNRNRGSTTTTRITANAYESEAAAVLNRLSGAGGMNAEIKLLPVPPYLQHAAAQVQHFVLLNLVKDRGERTNDITTEQQQWQGQQPWQGQYNSPGMASQFGGQRPTMGTTGNRTNTGQFKKKSTGSKSKSTASNNISNASRPT